MKYQPDWHVYRAMPLLGSGLGKETFIPGIDLEKSPHDQIRWNCSICASTGNWAAAFFEPEVLALGFKHWKASHD